MAYRVFQTKFGLTLLRDHSELNELQRKIHRFRATDESSLRSLAKDIVKATIERLYKKSLINALDEGNSDKGTLKLLESLLAKYTEEDYAHKQMTPLFGVYDLRNADAHLSSADVEECYKKLNVDRSAPLVSQAAMLIENIAHVFGVTGGDLNKNVVANRPNNY